MVTIKEDFKKLYGNEEVKLPSHILTINDNHASTFSSGSNGYLTKVRLNKDDKFEFYHDWWDYGWISFDEVKEKYPHTVCDIKSLIESLIGSKSQTKSHTDLEQSKKLAEILPIESADMFYRDNGIDVKLMWEHNAQKVTSPCWSLVALLDMLPKIINNETLFIEASDTLWHIGYRNTYTVRAGNLIDACYELIVHLYELKRL